MNRRISSRSAVSELLYALKRIATLHYSETFLGDQAASNFDVMTKDRVADLGNKSKSMCEYICER